MLFSFYCCCATINMVNKDLQIYIITYRRFVTVIDVYIDSLQPLVYYRLNSVVLVYTPHNNSPLLYTC